MSESKPYDLAALKIDRKSRTRSGPGMRTKALIVAVAVVVAVLVFMIFSGKKTVVEVSPARSISASEGASLLNASGYVTPRRRATVAAKSTGRVQELILELNRERGLTSVIVTHNLEMARILDRQITLLDGKAVILQGE